MQKPLNVLSLFNGMGCIWLALDKLGIPVNRRYVSEIDKHANTVNDANYPDTIHLGSVTEVEGWMLEDIDLLVGGSPCQGFSLAGGGLNFDDPRSKLFFEFVRLLKECKPKHFLLENVGMKKDHENIISEYMGCLPVTLNSSLLSAQNRKRLFWTNLPIGDPPKDKGLVVRDILEAGVTPETHPHLYVPQTKKFVPITRHNSKVGLKCLGGVVGPNGSLWNDAKNPGLSDFRDYQRVYDPEGKAPTLTTRARYIGHFDMTVLQRDFRQGDRVYCESGKAPTLNAQSGGTGRQTGLYATPENIRRLTRNECERLQTVPENYTAKVSRSQALKMLGNGWTVDIIAHLLKPLANVIP